MAGEISFFELGVEDPDRARVFYGELFGWTFEPGPSGGGFAITAPRDTGRGARWRPRHRAVRVLPGRRPGRRPGEGP
ncbi:VOC family protein [Streptomyces sp. SM11]|uniref:VOC family protein n=1 Tax=Streptomyces sp. SM11 TaxID=565557 RepID=UPI0035BC6346